MDLNPLIGTGIAAFVASIVTEIVKRGLGLQGRRAFLAFLGIAGAVLAVEIGASFSPYVQDAWNWLLALMVVIGIGTGHHVLISKDAQGNETITTDQTGGSSNGV